MIDELVPDQGVCLAQLGALSRGDDSELPVFRLVTLEFSRKGLHGAVAISLIGLTAGAELEERADRLVCSVVLFTTSKAAFLGTELLSKIVCQSG